MLKTSCGYLLNGILMHLNVGSAVEDGRLRAYLIPGLDINGAGTDLAAGIGFWPIIYLQFLCA